MIAKILHGSEVGGLIRYLYGPGRENEHTDPHLVGAWEPDASRLDPERGGVSKAELARMLEVPLSLQVNPPEKPVWHCSVSIPAEDGPLADAQWAEVAREIMDRTGLAKPGDDGGVRWVAVRHGLSAAGNDHIHIAAIAARQDGRKASLWQDRYRVGEACRAAEDRYGLTPTVERGSRTAPLAPTQAESRKHADLPLTRERVGDRAAMSPIGDTTAVHETARESLRREVRVAAASSASRVEFGERLATAGVVVRWRESERNPGEITGYAVGLAKDKTVSGGPVMFGGGKLAPDLSLPRLEATWGPARTHEANWPHALDRVGIVTEAATAARAAEVEVLRATTSREYRLGADSAHAAAGALAVAGRVVDGRQRTGPVTDAGDRFAGAGNEPYGRAVERTAGGDRLRAATRGLALLGRLGRDDDSAQLVASLASLARAVAELRRAQARDAQARAAGQAAERVVAVAPARTPARAAGRGLAR